MKQKHKIILSVISLFVAACIGVGLYLAHKNQEFQNEMFRIVHSEEVRELIVEELKAIDPNALTEKGKIRSYKIDDASIRHNPMGGIMVSIYVNDNKDYIFSFTLNKNFNTKKLTSEGGVTDPTIMKKVEERDKND